MRGSDWFRSRKISFLDDELNMLNRSIPSSFSSPSFHTNPQSDDRVLQHILEINKPTHVQVREKMQKSK